MKIDIDVPDGKSGNCEVTTFEVTEQDAKLFNIRAVFQPGGRTITPGTYKKLTVNGTLMMSNTPAEIDDHRAFIYHARRSDGHILINGLGLGVCLKAILESETVKSVTVIENSPDVIKLVAPTYLADPRVKIIEADAFTWQPPKGKRYSAVWHDIWPGICSDNIPEMTKLHRRYGKRADWQASWCREFCYRR